MPDPLRIVLVRPRDPNNIGAAARAMANFGFSDLRVVAPHPPVWREAKSAVGAEDLLRGAREDGTIAEAVAGCRRVWATSALKGRRPGLPVLELPSLRRPRGGAAILFGPEKTGLTGDDLAHASLLIRISTGARQPSMNLGAAVAVLCYEWVRGRTASPPALRDEPAGAEQKQRLWGLVEALAMAVGWPAGERTRRLKAAVYKSNISDPDAGMALELLRRLTLKAALLLLAAPTICAAGPESGRTGPVRSSHSSAALIAERSAVAPGESLRLALVLTPDPGWHVYWRNAGDSGAAPILKWKGSGNMQKLQKAYTDKGVVWLTIISSAKGKQGYVTGEEADRDMAEAKAAPSHVLLDPEGTAGRAYGAKTTPHLFVIDGEGILRYNGAIDSISSSEPEDIAEADNYAAAALDAVLAGKKVKKPVTRPYGCSVNYKA